MSKRMSRAVLAAMISALALGGLAPQPAHAASAEEIDRNADAALAQLYKTSASARALRDKAKGILVFPRVVKAGFLFGGQIGEGALREGGRTVGYYSTVAASYGLQAGVQAFGYVMFFMTDSSLAYLKKSKGFEIGVGPSVVVVDEGMGKSMTSTTMSQDVYAYIFDQKGLMAGLGIQGSKITRIAK